MEENCKCITFPKRLAIISNLPVRKLINEQSYTGLGTEGKKQVLMFSIDSFVIGMNSIYSFKKNI